MSPKTEHNIDGVEVSMEGMLICIPKNVDEHADECLER